MSIWDGFGGQERSLRFLQAASEAPSGAYLFYGPSGSGKTAAARLFAAAILCPDGGCGFCGTCTRVMRDLHPDVATYEPEGLTFPVDLIRDAVSSSAQSPLEATRRVFILFEADRIVERSQNTLLKALEEPSSRTVWVLEAGALDPFLPTVLSRCHLVEFASVPEERVRQILLDYEGVEESSIDTAVRASRGDVGRAIALATDDDARDLRSVAFKAAWDADTLEAAAGFSVVAAGLADTARARRAEVQKEELASFDDSAGTGRGAGAMRKRVIERHRRALRRVETESYIEFVRWMGAAFRDLAAASSGGDVVSTDFAEELQSRSGAAPAGSWLELADRALRTEMTIVENANANLALEALLIRRAQMRGYTFSS